MDVLRRLPLVLFFVLATSLHAQDTKRPLTLDDYGAWNRIAEVELSADGRWLAYALQPNDGNATLLVEELDGNRSYDAVNGADPVFSNDGRHVAFLTSPSEEEADELRSENEPVRRSLHVIDLETGERTEDYAVRAFTFDESSRFLAIHRDRSDEDAEHEGSDLLLRDLEADADLSFGNVSAFAFNESGSRLAYIVDADSEFGNGLFVVSPGDGRIRPIDTGSYRYEDLDWNDGGDALVVLRGTVPEGKRRRENVVVVASGLDGEPSAATYDPSSDATAASTTLMFSI